MRALLLVAGLLPLLGCSPPCVKVSQIICEAGAGEQDACQFLLHRERDDARAQDICKDILPAAKALGADRHSESARNDWKQARQSLTELGFRPDEGKADIGNKLINSGGIGGKLVKSLRDNSNEAEEHTKAAADRALQGEGQ